MNLFAKVALEVVNLLCDNKLFYYVAKRLGLFDAVFVMYPANQKFADHYTFRLRQRFIQWKPFIVGIVTHPSGKRTLSFAISTHLDEIANHSSYDLRLFHSRVEKIASSLGDVSIHFAGTLPSRLTGFKVNRGKNSKNERIATVDNVVRAIQYVRLVLNHSPQNPVIVLGSNGYIGKGVVKQLQESSCVVVGIDPKSKVANQTTVSSVFEFPDYPHLVVNITIPEAVNEYVDYLSSHSALLNEVFPQPAEDVLVAMRAKGARVFHLSGVTANAAPSFPFEYCGAVPCCAALHEEYDVKVIEL
jgi:hypothetical protein